MNQTLCALLCGESQKNAVGGEHFTEKSYEVYLEEDTPILSERFRLRDITGKPLGEFSVSQVVPLSDGVVC